MNSYSYYCNKLSIKPSIDK